MSHDTREHYLKYFPDKALSKEIRKCRRFRDTFEPESRMWHYWNEQRLSAEAEWRRRAFGTGEQRNG